MRTTLWHPIIMTLIAIWSLTTAEKNVESLADHPILCLILLAAIVSWFVYFMQQHKKGKIKRDKVNMKY